MTTSEETSMHMHASCADIQLTKTIHIKLSSVLRKIIYEQISVIENPAHGGIVLNLYSVLLRVQNLLTRAAVC